MLLIADSDFGYSKKVLGYLQIIESRWQPQCKARMKRNSQVQIVGGLTETVIYVADIGDSSDELVELLTMIIKLREFKKLTIWNQLR